MLAASSGFLMFPQSTRIDGYWAKLRPAEVLAAVEPIGCPGTSTVARGDEALLGDVEWGSGVVHLKAVSEDCGAVSVDPDDRIGVEVVGHLRAGVDARPEGVVGVARQLGLYPEWRLAGR